MLNRESGGKKKMSEFKDILIHKERCKILMNIDHAHHEFVDALSEIDKLLNEQRGTVIKDQKKIKVVRLPLQINGETIDCHVKQFKAFSLRKRLENLFVPPGAFRAWKGAKRLIAGGIATPVPIAALAWKSGLLRESFFISKTIPHSTISVHYFKKHFTDAAEFTKEKANFLQSMARAFRRLHDADIYHNDLKDYNILVNSDDASEHLNFWFLDVDCVSSFRGVTASRRIKNLAQLDRTLGKEMKPSDKMSFFRGYFGLDETESFSAEQEEMIQKVFRRSGGKSFGQT
jgi:hypothetical protein